MFRKTAIVDSQSLLANKCNAKVDTTSVSIETGQIYTTTGCLRLMCVCDCVFKANGCTLYVFKANVCM
jgi:hypothetical protein